MNVNAHNTWLCAAVLVASSAPGIIRADDSNPYAADPAVREPRVGVQSAPDDSWVKQSPVVFERAKTPIGSGFGPRANGPAAAIRKAAEAVRDAKDNQAKEAAQKKLIEVLDKCYDEDMVQREKELKQIEERLARLRELLERRRAKKQDIVDLQVKVALNEADGLGFYDGDRPGKGGAGGFSFEPRVRAAERALAAPVAAPAPRKEQPK